jgi:hypothetical protein
MADAGLFIGWDEPVTGREAQRLGVVAETLASHGKAEQDGRIEIHETFEPGTQNVVRGLRPARSAAGSSGWGASPAPVAVSASRGAGGGAPGSVA